MTGIVRPELLVTTDWLASQLDMPGTRVLDCRWRPDGTGAQAHAVAHVPGALHLDWAADLAERGEDGVIGLAGPDRVAATLERLAIPAGTGVVMYDDTMGLYASRAWWSLRAYGLEDVRVLEGGWPAWQAEGRPVRAGSHDLTAQDEAAPMPAIILRPNPRLRLSSLEVQALIGSTDVQLLDARAPAEFRGQEGNTRRLGHIPGAINVPIGVLHELDTQRLRAGARLQAAVQRLGVIRGRRLVCYDNSGVGAARLAFILALLGHEDVAVYDGGWADWGDRVDLPVER